VSRQIRVVLAEDQAMVLGALAALLEIERDIAVVARARNGREAMTLVAQHAPDVLLPLRGPVICAARWMPAPRDICSRTDPRRSWRSVCGASVKACGW
jgi:hypothetical protein